MEFRKIKNSRTCVNNSWTLALYELDMNGIIFPLCSNCAEELIKEMNEVIKVGDNDG